MTRQEKRYQERQEVKEQRKISSDTQISMKEYAYVLKI